MSSYTSDLSQQSRPTRPVDIGALGIAKVILKWSFVIAPLIAFGVYLAITETRDVAPTYTAEASLLLIGPNELQVADVETGDVYLEDVNPLMRLGGSLDTIAGIIVLAIKDANSADMLRSEALTTDYNIWKDRRSPVLFIEALHQNPEVAAATATRIGELVVTELDDRQNAVGAPEADRVLAVEVTAASVSAPDFNARTRLRIAILAASVAVAFAVAFLLEGLHQLWRRSRARKSPVPARPQPELRSLPVSRQLALPAAPEALPMQSQGLLDQFRTFTDIETDQLVSTLHLVTGDRLLAEAITEDSFSVLGARWPDVGPVGPRVQLYREAIGRARLAQESDALLGELIESDAQRGMKKRLWETTRSLDVDTRAVAALSSIALMSTAAISSVLGLSSELVELHLTAASNALDGARLDTDRADEAADKAAGADDEERQASDRVGDRRAERAARRRAGQKVDQVGAD